MKYFSCEMAGKETNVLYLYSTKIQFAYEAWLNDQKLGAVQ